MTDPRMDKDLEYSERWDAYYSKSKNEWAEGKCSDPDCMFCTKRPEKPMTKSINKQEKEG